MIESAETNCFDFALGFVISSSTVRLARAHTGKEVETRCTRT